MQIIGILVFISYGAVMVLIIQDYQQEPVQITGFRALAWNIVLIYVATQFLKRVDNNPRDIESDPEL